MSREKLPYYTEEERRTPLCRLGNDFEFNTSFDPNKLGVHVSPLGATDGLRNIQGLLNDVSIFNLYWRHEHWPRMNGFCGGMYKFVFHQAGWEPRMGYDAMVIDVKTVFDSKDALSLVSQMESGTISMGYQQPPEEEIAFLKQAIQESKQWLYKLRPNLNTGNQEDMELYNFLHGKLEKIK